MSQVWFKPYVDKIYKFIYFFFLFLLFLEVKKEVKDEPEDEDDDDCDGVPLDETDKVAEVAGLKHHVIPGKFLDLLKKCSI